MQGCKINMASWKPLNIFWWTILKRMANTWTGQKLDECRNLIGGWALWEGGGQGNCLTCNWEFNHLVPSALGTFLAPVFGFWRVRVLFSRLSLWSQFSPQGNPQICKRPSRLLDSGTLRLSSLHVTIGSTSHQLPSSQVTAHLSKSAIIELCSLLTRLESYTMEKIKHC